MLLMAVQPNLNASLKPLPFPSQKVKPFFEKPSIFAYPKTKTISFSNLKLTRQCHTHTTKFVKQVWASATAEATVAEEGTVSDDDFASVSPPDKEKLGVVVKPMEKPRVVLKFIWMEKNIGIALDRKIPGHGTIPLSPYYFWPRKDAWEELKVLLESKPWISQKQIIILLNQATDIINLWQQSGGNLA
ncbi:30S ribosomal protein 3, chloroplastic-like [Fagus crenata]